VSSNGEEAFIIPHTATVVAPPNPHDGELGGGEGSESGEAEDPETGRTFFMPFLNLETEQAGDSLCFLTIEKETAGVFRTPPSYERGTPMHRADSKLRCTVLCTCPVVIACRGTSLIRNGSHEKQGVFEV